MKTVAFSEAQLDFLQIQGLGNRNFFLDGVKIFEKVHIQTKTDSRIYITELKQNTQNQNVDMQGINLVIGYLDEPSYIVYEGGKYTKMIGETFENMKRQMNFTTTNIPSIDGKYGALVSGGVENQGRRSTHNGLIGMLERGEIDVALSDLALTYSRSRVVDFGGNIVEQSVFAMMARPGVRLQFYAYFNPFKTEIWIFVIITASVLTVACLALMLVSGHKLDNLGKNTVQASYFQKVLEVFSFTFRSMAVKDNFLLRYTKYTATWRILTLSMIVTGYFVVEVYNAELTSYLTSKEIQLPIKRVEDILDNDMKYSILDGTYMVTTYQFSEETDKQRIWKEKVENQEYGLISWEDKVISAAIKNNYVVAGYGNAVLDYIGRYPCFASVLPIEPMFPTQIGIYLEKNSALLPLFSTSLQFLWESGIVESTKQNSEKARILTTKVCANEDLKLGIQSTVFLFAWLAFGMISAVVLLMLECAVEWKAKEKTRFPVLSPT